MADVLSCHDAEWFFEKYPLSLWNGGSKMKGKKQNAIHH